MHTDRHHSFAHTPAIFPDFPLLDDEFDILGIEDGFYEGQSGKATSYFSRRVF